VRKTGEVYPLTVTQTHWSMEGRAIVREANLQQFKDHPILQSDERARSAERIADLSNPLDEAKKTAHHQWGLSIDLVRVSAAARASWRVRARTIFRSSARIWCGAARDALDPD